MHRFIRVLAIGICWQWSLPVSAAPVTCAISKLAYPLTTNESLATQLAAAESSFTVTCSCEEGETLVDNIGIVKLSIVPGQSNVYNGLAGIRLSGTSGDFGVETTEENYQVPSERVYEKTYSYFVKVSAPNGEFLQPNPDYAVAVMINLSSPPTCQSSGLSG